MRSLRQPCFQYADTNSAMPEMWRGVVAMTDPFEKIEREIAALEHGQIDATSVRLLLDVIRKAELLPECRSVLSAELTALREHCDE